MMAELIHINIRGLKVFNKAKIDKCCYILENVQSVLVLNIQETHLTCDADIPQKFSRYSHLYHFITSHACDADKGAGIIMLVNKTEEILETKSYVQGRLLYVKVKNKVSDTVCNIFSFYGKSHISANDISNYMCFFYEKITVENLSNVVVMVDFNFVTAETEFEFIYCN